MRRKFRARISIVGKTFALVTTAVVTMIAGAPGVAAQVPGYRSTLAYQLTHVVAEFLDHETGAAPPTIQCAYFTAGVG